MADINNLKEMIVLAIHTGKIYFVVEVVNNISAESPFGGNTDNASSKYDIFRVLQQKEIPASQMVCSSDSGDLVGADISTPLSLEHSLQRVLGYIRDSAFDPRRWVAPGQRFYGLFPVNVGWVLQKCLWMQNSILKTQTLIGAYYIGGGIIAALHLMKWLGIDAELDPSLVVEAITTASLRSYVSKDNEVATLESKLGYEFSVKGLLQEVITHASQQELGVGYCYQLTDLCSASVNNENFAQAAVILNLHQDLQHCSGLLLCQLTEYVKSISESHTDGSLRGPKGPEALGDMVESIARAILLDTKLNLNEVWRIYKPLLSPIVTPDKLELHPF
uniref:RNase III domain-containing protein n=1 Tax=Quercus lobata TaxID=97700 RepID=A0A7N2M5Y7_QUELO